MEDNYKFEFLFKSNTIIHMIHIYSLISLREIEDIMHFII